MVICQKYGRFGWIFKQNSFVPRYLRYTLISQNGFDRLNTVWLDRNSPYNDVIIIIGFIYASKSLLQYMPSTDKGLKWFYTRFIKSGVVFQHIDLQHFFQNICTAIRWKSFWQFLSIWDASPFISKQVINVLLEPNARKYEVVRLDM